MYSTTYDSKRKLWSGHNSPPIYHPNVSLGRVLLKSMQNFSSKIAQISDDSGIKVSFNELRTRTIRAAQNLQALGYNKNQVFGFMSKNSPYVAPIIIGSISIGCPVNTLDPSFGKTELLHMLNITKPVLLFCDVACYELLSKCLAELKNDAKIFTFGGTIGQSEPVENLFIETQNEDQFVSAVVDGSNETAMIVCSSGTTGLSKGVCLSHAALLNVFSGLCLDDFNGVFLCFSSLYWLSGVLTILIGTVFGQTRIITTESFSPELQLRIIEKYKVTITFGAPYQINLMMKSDRFSKTDISSLKYLLVGGSKVPHHIKVEMKKYLPHGQVIIGYGMTELGAISLDYPESNKPDSIGRLAEGCCVKIVDDDGNRCGINEDGEICVKAPYHFLGYFGNEKATMELFDEEGFLLTGDVGHFDEDGYLYFVERKKDLIKYLGFQISPSEIDAYLIESPEIKSACVVGIPEPTSGTELPAAVIVRTERSNISENDVCNMVADRFADYCKFRGGVYFVDELPTTPSGKVLRRAVKEIAIKLRKN